MLKFPKKGKPKSKGSKTEAPVQAAVNAYLDLKGIRYFRLPDQLFKTLVYHLTLAKRQGRVKEQIKTKELMKELKGWPDNMAFVPYGDYLLACPIECKSATGKTHGKQKVMAKELNYHIPRSEEEGIKIINTFIEYCKQKGVEL